MITVIKKYMWEHGQNNAAEGGLVSQLSFCDMRGVKFWVRENINNADSFHISSGERWGDKAGSTPSWHRQRLELFLPHGSEKAWRILAELVRRADAHHRPVAKNKLFNQAWIDDYLKRGNPSDRYFEQRALIYSGK